MHLLVQSVHKEMVLLGVMETVFGQIMSVLKQEVKIEVVKLRLSN